MTANGNTLDRWSRFTPANMAYMYEQYELYMLDPDQVDGSVRSWFERNGAPPGFQPDHGTARPIAQTESMLPDDHQDSLSSASASKVAAAVRLATNIRTYGHLAANIDPLLTERHKPAVLEPEFYQLGRQDLERIPAELLYEGVGQPQPRNGREAIDKLKQLYTRTAAFQFSHVHDEEERRWLNEAVESERFFRPPDDAERKQLLFRLTEVQEFETFLHTKFVGQKRFSIEGLDMLVPMIDAIISEGMNSGARSVLMGMAHRGRLNVLAHVLGKPYGEIFAEFHRSIDKEMIPSEGSMGINHGWTGDVKYHKGADFAYAEGEQKIGCIILSHNPSHLEFVNPVTEGATRAAQEDTSTTGFPALDVHKAFTILVHGDASFPGEGIVGETLNLSRLPGFRTGGTIHLIANNQIGFTTNSDVARSTEYASDPARGFEIPMVHVNADDPEACLAAARFAYAYRQRFCKDFIIDLIGYRRFGHNEGDDPVVTQPVLYERLKKHPVVSEQYGNRLVRETVVTEQEWLEKRTRIREQLQRAYEQMISGNPAQSLIGCKPFVTKNRVWTRADADFWREIASPHA